jgi:serine/threonine-protein kinase RsbW
MVAAVPLSRSLHLPEARLADLAAIRAFLQAAGTDLGVADEAISDVVIAVNEAAANVLRHGYLGVPGPLEVVIEREPDSVVVRVRDEAPPFDPTTYPAPDLGVPLEGRRAGGLGIHLARTCVDEMTHSALRREGNELTLVKSLRGQEGGTT